MSAARFTEVQTVAIPVRDQDAALAFYTGPLGLEVRFDAELQPGFRWIDVAAPGATTSLALVRAGEQLPAGVDTGIRLATPDAAAAHAALTQAGADVGELLLWESAPPMFEFRDPDGNTVYVTESPAG
ncbi:VOC family protein [Krasilnikoviella flava]|uniref:Catechol 2,3-dioxygenase n=1 Tax=Krasilnikoviella flava TaxID=526729 RepID=A0A1T5JFT5_9MICO|nr:VOC family protein [Krasilnikoviella flava]SKC50033.1 Catechol 2,3-dioxygenase [Krasilnikoviella flava]